MGELARRRFMPVGTLLGNFSIGASVWINENRTPVEYLVVHQGIPSAMYDISCDGTWLLRKNIFEKKQWHSSGNNNWANSSLKSYLDDTFFLRFDTKVQQNIKQAKIPCSENGTNMVISDLSCKVFLLSGYEAGWTEDEYWALPVDGAKLSYFDYGEGTTAKAKRIAYYDNIATRWWLRSSMGGGLDYVWDILDDGGISYFLCTHSYDGIRPTIILPQKTIVQKDLIIKG